MDSLCLHCDARLTPKDLRDGWCDSCGKRVPPSQAVAVRRAVPSKPTAAPDGEPMSVGKILLAVLAVLAITYFVTMALQGDRGSPGALLKIGVRAAAVLVAMLPVALFRLLRARA